VQTDVLIAGQGIAGSLLAWFLRRRGLKVLVADPGEANTSSRVAAGMIHPVTGRRVVKSWNADLFIPFSRKTYLEIEDRLAVRFFEDYPVLEIFPDAGSRNDWAGRSAEEGMQAYIGEECNGEALQKNILAPYGARWVSNGGWVDTRRFLDAMRNWLDGAGALLEERIQMEEVDFREDSLVWKEVQAKTLVDCTGFGLARNPFFTELPFQPCKGQLLKINARELPGTYILNRSYKLIPLGAQEYLLGATYETQWTHEDPDAEGRDALIEGLTKMISVPFTVLDHYAAVRPSTLDRRPIVGPHHSIRNLYAFSGLGSKGIMMGPWFADLLAKHFSQGEEIPEMYLPGRGR